MPIYEYQCSNCNHHFDVIQKVNDEPIKTCPQCAEDKAIRLVSAAGFQLKGSGWYATDFKNKPTSSPAQQEAQSTNTDVAPDKTSTNSTKSESKTE